MELGDSCARRRRRCAVPLSSDPCCPIYKYLIKGHIMPTLDTLINVPEQNIYFDLRELVKIYPNKTKLFLFKNPNTIRKKGFVDSLDTVISSSTKPLYPSEDSLARSIRRSRQLITDVVLCNDFELFCTFTFKEDRQNIEKCKSKMKQWLKNQKQKYGTFSYIIVPEFHKDKKSLHFHALFQGYKGKLTDSGIIVNGRNSYNINSYRSGFTSAVYIDNKAKVSNYVRKYITKDMPTFSGKKRFWLSTGLKRPLTVQNGDFINNPAYKWSKIHTNELFTYYETKEIIRTSS